jgi:hypothetical protein
LDALDAGLIRVDRVNDATVAHTDEVAEKPIAHGSLFVTGANYCYTSRVEDFVKRLEAHLRHTLVKLGLQCELTLWLYEGASQICVPHVVILMKYRIRI